MKQIVVFNPIENEIFNSIVSTLELENNRESIKKINNNKTALIDLAQAISFYPSILGTQQLGKTSRSIETLVNSLCIKRMDLVLQIPTKAILGKSFTIAKINFFFMLLYLTRDIFTTNNIYEDVIINILYNNTFTLMAEEVFLSIIADNTIPLDIRTNAGYLLAHIWEYRIDHSVKEFSPILSSVWHARKNMQPVFGTMMGTTELFKFSRETDSRWLDYIKQDEIKQEEIDSVYEFLMGLSYEEMNNLINIMEQTGKSLLKEDEIEKILGNKKNYPFYTSDDPRDLYNFFKMRHENAMLRAKIGQEGPKKTTEEYLMCYLLSLSPDSDALPILLKRQQNKGYDSQIKISGNFS